MTSLLRDDVAIIGLACRVPQARSASDLWSLLTNGRDVVTALPQTRFPNADATLFGGFIDGVDEVDAGFFDLSPREAATMDPQQRLLLEIGYEALQDAGLRLSALRQQTTGVFVGMQSSDYDKFNQSAGADLFSVVGASRNAAAGRLSYAFGLRGPSLVVDTDRSSSLVAVHMAVRALRDGDAQVALAAGANVILDLNTTRAFQRAGMLAADGRCKFGDARADGFVRAEGVAVVVLKRLQDALRDGDRVYATIKGSAVAHMGDASVDLMTPSESAQEDLLRAAYQDAQVAPSSVTYVEAHGPGTPVGDPIELQALGRVLGAGRTSTDACLVGSIKSNIGHAEAAAGILGLIKVALMLSRRHIPATLHVQSPNPAIAFDALGMKLASHASAWPATSARLAGVTSLGLTGTAAHVVLACAPDNAQASLASEERVRLIALSAKTPEALQAIAQRYVQWIDEVGDVPLEAVGAYAAQHRDFLDCRLGVVAASRQELRQRLDAYVRGEMPAGVVHNLTPRPRGKLAFVFSGQGSQYLSMGRELMVREPVFQEAIRACEVAIKQYADWSLTDMLATGDAGVWRLDVVQPMLFAVSVALAKLWRSWGVQPDAVIGASMGEVAAAHIAGRLSLDDAARIICRRSQLALKVAGNGGMLVVGLGLDEARALLQGREHLVSVAVSASPASSVLSGETVALQHIAQSLEARRVFARFVRVDFASHSPFVEPLREALLAVLRPVTPQLGDVAMYSTVNDALVTAGDLDAAYWVRNLRDPVLFGATVQRMLADGYDTFVECSPHPLQWDALIDNSQARGIDTLVLPSLRREDPTGQSMLASLGALYARGFAVRWDVLYPTPVGSPAQPSYAWQRQRYWIDAAPPGAPVVARQVAAPVAASLATSRDAGRATVLSERLANAGETERREVLGNYLRALVGRVLGVADVASLDATRPLKEYGLKSVMAVELRALLGESLGKPLPASLIFTYPTIEKLVAHLLGDEFPGQSQRRAAQARLSEPIAIVGMACRFPGAASADAYWELLREGKDAVREVPADRWDVASTWDPDASVAGKMVSRFGGFLDDIALFDAEFFNLAPAEAARMDPQQRLLLEVTADALDVAGQSRDRLHGSRTGVFVGIMNTNEYASVKGLSTHLQAIMAQDAVADATSVAAGRLAYVFGLQGPTMAVDTACSSALVAVHLAMRSLRTGESRMAIAAGVNVILTPEHSIAFSRGGMLSPDGRCKTFSAEANGYVRSEGCGVVVLKRLADALADGDNVLAVIRGSAVNQDGRSNGLTAPNAQAQESLLNDALTDAGLSAAQVGYVEAHGTGTPLGDPIEMQALEAAYGSRRDGTPLWVGSAKTNIGHLEAAAGIAGLIKAVQMLRHRAIAPHLHFTTINPHIAIDPSHIRIAGKQVETWDVPQGSKRIAGVSSFGFSGTNAHVLLEEATPSMPSEHPTTQTAWPVVLPLSARNAQALRTQAAQHAAFVAQHDELSLEDIAHSAATRRTHHEHRIAVIANERTSVVEALGAYARGEKTQGLVQGEVRADGRHRVAFVFPGHGAQWLGMGRDMLAADATFRASIEACDAAIRKCADLSVLQELQASAEASRLQEIDVVQPVLFTVQVALAAWWRSIGIVPDAIIGHSMGEIAAAHVAGVYSLEDAAKIICARSRGMRQVAGQGAMVSVELTPQGAQPWLDMYDGQIAIAVQNGPQSLALAGDVDAINDLHRKMTAKGLFCARVKTDVAFHTGHMDQLVGPLVDAVRDLQPALPAVTMYSTVTGERLTNVSHDASYWGRNLRDMVQFAAATRAAWDDGVRFFLEISAQPLLVHPLRALTDSDPADVGLATGSLRRDRPGRSSLYESLAALFAHGYPVNFVKVEGDARRTVVLPAYPWQRQRHWADVPKTSTRRARHGEHALLGHGFTVAGQRDVQYWQNTLSLADVPYLADHVVAKTVVFPGAGYIELMLFAARQAWPQEPLMLSQLNFVDMLTLPEEGGREIQVELTTGDAARIRVHSRAEKGWRLHAEARVLRGHSTAAAALSQQTPTGDSLDAAAVYATLASAELHYGPTFRNIDRVWLGAQEGVGRLRPGGAHPGYLTHPALLDAALHVMALQIWNVQGRPAQSGAWVPVEVGQIVWHASLDAAAFSRVRLDASTSADAGVAVGDVDVFDAQGALLLSAQGMKFKRLPAQAAVSTVSEEFFLHYVWERLAAVSVQGESPLAGQAFWVLGDDQHGLSDAVQKALTERGASVTLMPPASLAHALKDAAAPHGIINLSALSAPTLDDTAESLLHAQRAVCDHALALVQAVTSQGWRDLPRLWMVTMGAQRVGGESHDVDVGQAPLWGLSRSLVYEYPDLRCTRVDVRLGHDSLRTELAAEALVNECLSDAREDEIALRPDGLRFGGRLRRGRAQPHNTSLTAMRGDSTYLITGGLGGLGLQLAAWMAAQGAGHVVLAQRSGVPTDEQRTAIDAMKGGVTQVHVVATDLGKADDIARLLQHVRTTLPPLRGIVHAAAVLDDGLIMDQTPARMLHVMQAKAHGAWRLHRATANDALDFFVSYGSIVSVLGGAGQSNYAAANAFLDALAWHRQAHGQVGLTLDWGPFADVGLAAAQQKRGSRLAQRGLRNLTLAQGLEVFADALRYDAAQLSPALFDARQWVEFYPQLAASNLFKSLTQLDARADARVATAGDVRAQLQAAPAETRPALLEKILRGHIADILGVIPAKIGRETAFQALGVDSLMGLELRNRLEAAFAMQFSATLTLSHFNLGAMHGFLMKELGIAASAVQVAPSLQTSTQVVAEVAPAEIRSQDDLIAGLEAELSLLTKDT